MFLIKIFDEESIETYTPTVDISHTLHTNFNEFKRRFAESSLLLRKNVTDKIKENMSGSVSHFYPFLCVTVRQLLLVKSFKGCLA